jgi:hypothetical protein
LLLSPLLSPALMPTDLQCIMDLYGESRHKFCVKVIVQHVRLGAERYRVIRPGTPLSNATLHGHGHDAYSLYVDQMDGRRVGILWLLAARSPRSLVYLPMRATSHCNSHRHVGSEYGNESLRETPFVSYRPQACQTVIFQPTSRSTTPPSTIGTTMMFSTSVCMRKHSS